MHKTLTHSTTYVAVVAVLFGMLPAFGTPAAVLVALIALPAFSWQVLKDHRLFLLLIMQYPIIQMGLNLWHTPGFWEGQNNDSYLAMMIVLPFVLSLVVQSFQKADVFLMWLAAGLMFSFVTLAVDFTFLLNGALCRAGGFMMNPLLTPPVLIPLTFLVFVNWNTASKRSKALAYFVLFGALMSILVFNGSRMATYAFCATIAVLAIWLRFFQKERFAFHTIALIAGLCALFGLAVEVLSDCVIITRMLSTLDTVVTLLGNIVQGDSRVSGTGDDVLDMGVNLSDAYRWATWHGAIDAIQNSPLIGYGHNQEKEMFNIIAQTNILHAHNQYLSWALWGGGVATLSGLAAVLSPAVVGRWSFPVSLAIFSMMLMFLTDSTLAADDGIHTILLMLCALYAAKTQRQKSPPSS